MNEQQAGPDRSDLRRALADRADRAADPTTVRPRLDAAIDARSSRHRWWAISLTAAAVLVALTVVFAWPRTGAGPDTVAGPTTTGDSPGTSAPVTTGSTVTTEPTGPVKTARELLVGTSWRLVAVDVEELSDRALEYGLPRMTISFGDDWLGLSGCRTVTGSVTYGDSDIKGSYSGPWTYQYCRVTDEIAAALFPRAADRASPRVPIEVDPTGGHLTIGMEGGTVTFERCFDDDCAPELDPHFASGPLSTEQPSPPVSTDPAEGTGIVTTPARSTIAGSTWSLTSMDVDGTVSSAPDQLAPTLLEFFDTGMQLTNECRSYGVRATFSDDTILITKAPGWTFQYCGLTDSVFRLMLMDRDQRPLAFELDAEQHTITFTVDGGTVTFERCSGDDCPDVDAF